MTWIVALLVVVIVTFFLYAVMPNALTRCFHLFAVRTGPRERVVALTFDDGPDPQYTPRLLDVLQADGVRATFFVIALKAMNHPELVRRMIAEGHDVQIHGYTHALVPALSPRAAVQQVALSAHELSERFGLTTTFYRPTWGLLSLATLLSRACRTHKLMMWSVMVGDWLDIPTLALQDRIMTRIHPGAIIVLHDSDETWGAKRGAPERVIEVIPAVIERLRSNGYEFRTVAEWLGEG